MILVKIESSYFYLPVSLLFVLFIILPKFVSRNSIFLGAKEAILHLVFQYSLKHILYSYRLCVYRLRRLTREGKRKRERKGKGEKEKKSLLTTICFSFMSAVLNKALTTVILSFFLSFFFVYFFVVFFFFFFLLIIKERIDISFMIHDNPRINRKNSHSITRIVFYMHI